MRKVGLPAGLWGGVALVLIPLLLVGVSLGAGWVARGLGQGLDTYEPPALSSLPEGENSTPLAERVVVVVVDGLRADVSRQMPYLESLRGRGAWTTLRTGQPSFSKPGFAVLSTGTWPELSGVTMNSRPGGTPVETIFQVAARAGRKTALFGNSYWAEINPAVDFPFTGDYPDHEIYARARGSIAAREATLTYVHLSAVDDAGHKAGGASSSAYLEAAREVDGMIAGLASGLDLTRDVLVVTADHGHLDRNDRRGSGHGGWEKEVTTVPLVVVGDGVAPGEMGAARQVDLAPTVATILGLPVPAQSVGHILWPALTVGPEARADKQIKRAQQYLDLARAYGAALGATIEVPTGVSTGAPEEGGGPGGVGRARELLAQGDAEGAFQTALESEREAETLMARARAGALWKARWRRLPVLLAPLIPIGLGIWKWRRLLFVTLAGGGVYLLLFHVFYRWVFGRPYSLSVFPDSSVLTMVRLIGLPSFLALAALVALVFWMGTGAKGEPHPLFPGRLTLVWLSEKAMLFPYATLAVLAAVGFFWLGYGLVGYLPDLRSEFLFFAVWLQMACLGLPAVALPLLTWLGSRTRRPEATGQGKPAPSGDVAPAKSGGDVAAGAK